MPAGNGEIPPWSLPLKAPPSSRKSSESDGGGSGKSGYSRRMGQWEEMYDAVDGAKTWYNRKTPKTTKKDLFW